MTVNKKRIKICKSGQWIVTNSGADKEAKC